MSQFEGIGAWRLVKPLFRREAVWGRDSQNFAEYDAVISSSYSRGSALRFGNQCISFLWNVNGIEAFQKLSTEGDRAAWAAWMHLRERPTECRRKPYLFRAVKVSPNV